MLNVEGQTSEVEGRSKISFFSDLGTGKALHITKKNQISAPSPIATALIVDYNDSVKHLSIR